MTPDPFSSCELVGSGYDSRVYQSTPHLLINLMVILTSSIICLVVSASSLTISPGAGTLGK